MLLYSGKLVRQKTFTNFTFERLFFLAELFISCAYSRYLYDIHKTFLANGLEMGNSRMFSVVPISRYTVSIAI